MFELAMQQNLAVMRQLAAAPAAPGPVCDIGCWDGATFRTYAPVGRPRVGLEGDADAAAVARSNGIDAITCDLRDVWPIADASIGVVTSNQVIEHLLDIDQFVRETSRVLRPGGHAVISTENLASWHNIAALMFGWQPFSLTNVSDTVPGLGNPLANLRHGAAMGAGWQHVHVLAARALRELFANHGFSDVCVRGAGYYPFPRALARLDATHAAFITVSARRPAR